MRPGLHRLLAVAVLAAVSLSLSACSNRSSPDGGGRLVSISVKDFKISAPRRLAPGAVDFSVINRGPDAHELIVVRSDSSRLPRRSDGATVDEEGLESKGLIDGALEPGAPGSVRHLRIRLRPGRYELICNMAGHFDGGMRTALVVS